MLEREKTTKEDGKEDQEDARPSILTGAARSPRRRIKWCRVGEEEGHLHT